MKILVLNDTRAENHHGCSRVMNAIDRNLFLRKENDISYLKLMMRWDLYEDIKRKIIQSDLLIINGEGTLHGDLEHVKCLLNAINFAKSYGVTVAVVNATVYDLSRESIKKLSKVDYLYVRDTSSKRLMEENGVNASYCPDLVFWEPVPMKFEGLRSGTVVTDGYGSIRHVGNNEGDSCSYISISNAEQNYYNSSKLRKILIKLKTTLGINSTWRQENQSTHIDFLMYLNSFEFVITGRYHIICMCLLCEIPFKFIESNTPKNSFLLEDLGLDINKFRYFSGASKADYDSNDLSKIKKFKSDAQIIIREMFDNILTARSAL